MSDVFFQSAFSCCVTEGDFPYPRKEFLLLLVSCRVLDAVLFVCATPCHLCKSLLQQLLLFSFFRLLFILFRRSPSFFILWKEKKVYVGENVETTRRREHVRNQDRSQTSSRNAFYWQSSFALLWLKLLAHISDRIRFLLL